MSELGRVSINLSIYRDVGKTRKALGIKHLSQVVEAVQLMSDIKLHEVVLRARNRQSGIKKILRLILCDYCITNVGIMLTIAVCMGSVYV